MDERQLKIILKMQDDASKELRKVVASLDSAEVSTNKWTDSLSKMRGIALGASAAVGASLVGLLGYGLDIAGQLETAQSALTGLLGSSEEAQKTMDRIKKEAAATPFEMVGLTEGVKQLAAVTKTGDEAIDILMSVGKAITASGGGQVEMDRVVYNLKQIKGIGKLEMIDLKELRRAIPIFDKLVEAAGTTIEQIQAAKDPASELFRVFIEGGKKIPAVADAYINQAGNFKQLVSNAKDVFAIFTADLVKSTGVFNLAKKILSEFVEVLGQMIAWAKENPKLTQAILATAAAFAIIIPVAAAFGVAMALISWPILAIVAGFTALVAIIGIFATNWKEIMAFIDENTGLITFLSEVWNLLVSTIRDMLMPALMELWEALKPYQPLLETLAKLFGGALVVAIGLFIMGLAGLAVTLTTFITIAAKVSAFLLGEFSKAWDWVTDKIAGVINIVDRLIAKFEKAIELASRIASKVGGAVSGAVSSFIPGRATGGPVSAGRQYLVGEKGPEYFVPNSNGSIIPNSRFSGSGVNITIYGDVTGDDVVDKISKALADRIKYRTLTA